MKIKLKVSERLELLRALPKEGNDINLRIIRELDDMVGVNTKEQEKLKIRVFPDKSVSWDADIDGEGKECEFNSIMVSFLHDVLSKKNAESKLTLPLLDLYDAVRESDKQEGSGDIVRKRK